MNPPFNTLSAVNELIYLYKKGYSTPQLAIYFDTNKGNCLKTLRFHNVPIRSSYAPQVQKNDHEFSKKRYTDKFEKKTVVQRKLLEFEKGKYDHLFEEPIREGKNYKELLNEKGIKIHVENWSVFSKIRIDDEGYVIKSGRKGQKRRRRMPM